MSQGYLDILSIIWTLPFNFAYSWNMLLEVTLQNHTTGNNQ